MVVVVLLRAEWGSLYIRRQLGATWASRPDFRPSLRPFHSLVGRSLGVRRCCPLASALSIYLFVFLRSSLFRLVPLVGLSRFFVCFYVYILFVNICAWDELIEEREEGKEVALWPAGIIFGYISFYRLRRFFFFF